MSTATKFRKYRKHRRISFKKKDLWDLIKNITIIVSLVVNIMLVFAFFSIITRNFSVIIDKICYATISEKVSLKIPVTFYLDSSTVVIKGYAFASLPKGTRMPVKITLQKPRILFKLHK